VTPAYRAPAPKPAEKQQPDELVYAPADPERHVGPLRRAIQASAAAALVGGLLIARDATPLGVALMVLAGGWGMWQWRRTADVNGVVLRVADGELEVTPRGSSAAMLRIRLPELRDVQLDTKTIRKVGPDRRTVHALPWTLSSVGPEIDVARITLVPDGARPPVHLTDAYLAHIESVQWLGRIRAFLRGHGWLPEDERGADE
jgi:hypothetical protein